MVICIHSELQQPHFVICSRLNFKFLNDTNISIPWQPAMSASECQDLGTPSEVRTTERGKIPRFSFRALIPTPIPSCYIHCTNIKHISAQRRLATGHQSPVACQWTFWTLNLKPVEKAADMRTVHFYVKSSSF
jgi:hypothetical protein